MSLVARLTSLSTEYYMTLHSLFQGVTPERAHPERQLFDGKSALEIEDEAYIRFETIMRIRYLRHSFDAYDAWGLLYLIYLGNLALDVLNSDNPVTTARLTTVEITRSTAALSVAGLVAQSQSVYAGTLLSRSITERLKPADKRLLGRHILEGAGQIDQPFDSEVRSTSIVLAGPLADTCPQWPMPNIKVERDQEASMNHILKEVCELSIVQKAGKQENVPSS